MRTVSSRECPLTSVLNDNFIPRRPLTLTPANALAPHGRHRTRHPRHRLFPRAAGAVVQARPSAADLVFEDHRTRAAVPRVDDWS